MERTDGCSISSKADAEQVFLQNLQWDDTQGIPGLHGCTRQTTSALKNLVRHVGLPALGCLCYSYWSGDLLNFVWFLSSHTPTTAPSHVRRELVPDRRSLAVAASPGNGEEREWKVKMHNASSACFVCYFLVPTEQHLSALCGFHFTTCSYGGTGAPEQNWSGALNWINQHHGALQVLVWPRPWITYSGKNIYNLNWNISQLLSNVMTK